jgi:hypothetical protein
MPAADICNLEIVDDRPAKPAVEVGALEFVDDEPDDRTDDVCGLEIVEDSPPDPESEECELEVVEDSPPDLDDDIIDLELADGEPPLEDTPLSRRPAAKAPPPMDDEEDDEEEEPERPRKQRKPKKPKIEDPEQDKAMALFYGSSANADITIRNAEMRKKKAWKKQLKWWGQWEEGVTIGGVHISGFIIIGGGMLTTGLLCLAVIWALYTQGMWIPVRLIGAAVIYTLIGLVVLVRGLFSS